MQLIKINLVQAHTVFFKMAYGSSASVTKLSGKNVSSVLNA